MGIGQNSDNDDSGLGMMDISEERDFDDDLELDVYTQPAGEGFRRIKEQNFAEAENFARRPSKQPAEHDRLSIKMLHRSS